MLLTFQLSATHLPLVESVAGHPVGSGLEPKVLNRRAPACRMTSVTCAGVPFALG